MQKVSRRKLLKTGVLLGGGTMLATLPGLGSICGHSTNSVAGGKLVKISPAPGVSYTKATLELMDKARFDTVKEALQRFGNQRISFYLENV